MKWQSPLDWCSRAPLPDGRRSQRITSRSWKVTREGGFATRRDDDAWSNDAWDDGLPTVAEVRRLARDSLDSLDSLAPKSR
jgi:hypothetical protein